MQKVATSQHSTMSGTAARSTSMHIEELKSELTSLVGRLCNELQDLWKVFGVKTQQQKTKMVLNHLGATMGKILTEEKRFYQRLMDNIKHTDAKIHRLCEELSLPPYQQPGGLSLSDLETLLNAKVVTLENDKKLRMEKLGDLTRQEQELRTTLAMQPFSVDLTGGIPSNKQLVDLQHHVTTLKVEREKRVARVRLLKRNMEKLKEDLEFSPKTPFLRQTFFAPEADILSSETISKMNTLMEKMETKNNENKKHAEELRAKLNTLWDRLNTDPQQRELVLGQHSGNKPSSVRALHGVVKRYEAQATEIMEQLIRNQRTQLQDLWRKCYSHQEEIDGFVPFHSGNYTEEVLRFHEMEVRKWQNYYTRWAKLFENLSNLKTLWQRLMEFEDKQRNNPKRFVNRGGALLQEEKTKKRFNREIQETEDAIETLSSEYQQQEIRQFHIEGRTVQAILSQHRKEYARIFKNAKSGPARK